MRTADRSRWIVGTLVAALVSLAPPIPQAESAASEKDIAAGKAPAPSAAGDSGARSAGIDLVAALQSRTEALDRREQELTERERSSKEVIEEARELLAELATRRALVEQRIAALEKLQGDGVSRLAKVYSAMPPARAAALLEELGAETASALLAQIKPKKSAALLAAMEPESALRLTRVATLPLGEQPAASGAEPAIWDPGDAAAEASAPAPPATPGNPDDAGERTSTP